MNFVCKKTVIGLIFVRRCCQTGSNVLNSLDKRCKSEKIGSSIKLYLQRSRDYDNLLESQRKEFERGRSYLAQIMGEDPERFTQEQVDEAIQYLLPSALFSKRARPQLKPPEFVYPEKKKIQCDATGRPLHHMFYTRHPQFYSIMHEAVLKLENLKHEADYPYIYKNKSIMRTKKPIVLWTSEWMSKKKLEESIGESISDRQYQQWLTIMKRIVEHPLASNAEEFISRFRSPLESAETSEKLPEPLIDAETKRRYIVSYGQKKTSFAEVITHMPGNGEFSVNGKRLLESFPKLGDREQIMFPLQLTKTLGKIDISASLKGDGKSSLANALRLAIARSLASLLPSDQGKDKLKIAGLLTQDHRLPERKQPGQKKARKKPIWKAR